MFMPWRVKTTGRRQHGSHAFSEYRLSSHIRACDVFFLLARISALLLVNIGAAATIETAALSAAYLVSPRETGKITSVFGVLSATRQ
jgi:hypothetical protein